MIYTKISSDDVKDRARLRYALRQLMLKDLEFMEDIPGCDYCDATSEGHAEGCVLMNAALTVYAEELESLEKLRSALGDLLLADNALLGDTEYICPYCDETLKHDDECVYARAIDAFRTD